MSIYLSICKVNLTRLRAAGGLETTDQENVENLRKNLPSSASSAQETGASSGYSSGRPTCSGYSQVELAAATR